MVYFLSFFLLHIRKWHSCQRRNLMRHQFISFEISVAIMSHRSDRWKLSAITRKYRHPIRPVSFHFYLWEQMPSFRSDLTSGRQRKKVREGKERREGGGVRTPWGGCGLTVAESKKDERQRHQKKKNGLPTPTPSESKSDHHVNHI